MAVGAASLWNGTQGTVVEAQIPLHVYMTIKYIMQLWGALSQRAVKGPW